MSSISAQGVVERASAELTKRINGLGLKASKHHGVGKASVMERVTNALCGSGEVPYSKLQTAHNANATPEKPSRSVAASVGGMPSVNKKRVSTRGCDRMMRSRLRYAPGGYVVPATWDQLMQDDHFLGKFFLYFNAIERRILAQVCTRWRDILYARPRLWAGLVPVIRCREFRIMPPSSRIRLYDSLVRRGFHSLVLLGAVDEDIRELIHRFPQSQRSVHSLSLKCCAVTDPVLETLLDHLQELFELELAGCNEITETGLWTSLSPKIVSLSLSDCINVANEAVGAVVELLPSLYEFSLQAYHVTDAAFEYFKTQQSSPLRILRLQSCWELTNHGVHIITQALPNLTVLSLSGCSKVTNNGVELIAENLPELRSLDLSWCSRITDAALEYIACELINLEELTLDRCVHITDIGVGYISKMETLNALFLRWCSQLRDFGLQHLCGMKSLQVLSVAGCPLLTSTGLSSLIQLRRLHELELTNCPGTSQELFDYLREHLPRCLIIE